MRMLMSILFLVLGLSAFAQKKKENAKENSTERYFPKEDLAPETKKKKSTKVTHEAREKFYVRQEVIKKDRDKNYGRVDRSKPPYFGHKHPPTIRPVGKRKLCKVCGMTH